MGCSRGKGNARCGTRDVSRCAERKICWKPQRQACCLASLSVSPCLKQRAATSDSSL